MADQLQGLRDLAFDGYTLLISGAVYFAIRAVAHTAIARAHLYRRVLPILPESLGIVAVLLGGVPSSSGQPSVVQIAIGLWIGYVAQRFHKILGQTLLGDDERIQTKALPRPDPALHIDDPGHPRAEEKHNVE